MAAVVSDVQGLVTVGDKTEEILKNEDPVTMAGGILKMSDLSSAKITFDNGRTVELEGPTSIKLDESFFAENSLNHDETVIGDIQSLHYLQNGINDIEVPVSELNTNELGIEQVASNVNLSSEQLDTQLNSAERNIASDTHYTPAAGAINIENTPTNSIITDNITNTPGDTTENIVFDIIAPTTPTSDIANYANSGSHDDKITNNVTPTIEGKAEAGSTVAVTYTAADGTEHTESAVADTNGNYSVSITHALAEGSNDVSVTATDASGNTSEANALSLTVDTTTSLTSDLDAASDSGSSDSDNITSDTTPTINGTGEAGATVAISYTDAKHNS